MATNKLGYNAVKSREHLNDFDNIPFSKSLPEDPTYFKLFVWENQKLLFEALEPKLEKMM